MMISTLTEIDCAGCGMTLRPDHRSTRTIGGLGVVIGAVAGLAGMRLYGLGAVVVVLLGTAHS